MKSIDGIGDYSGRWPSIAARDGGRRRRRGANGETREQAPFAALTIARSTAGSIFAVKRDWHRWRLAKGADYVGFIGNG